MTEIPNRVLTPAELAELKEQKKLEKALNEVEEQFMKRAEAPSKWFGWLLSAFVVACFLDITGWISAFLSGRFYYYFSFVLQTTETVCIIAMAGLAIFGTIEAYKKHQVRQQVAADFSKG